MLEKVVGERSTSFAIRYFDLTDGFLLALDYPLTGMGLDDARYKEIRSESYSLKVLRIQKKGIQIL